MAGQVLVEAVALNILKLNENGARLRPFPKLVESDRSDNGAEFIVVNVIGKLIVIEAARCLDRLLENLHCRIGERRLVEAERIDARFLGLALVLLEKFLNAGEIHFRAR